MQIQANPNLTSTITSIDATTGKQKGQNKTLVMSDITCCAFSPDQMTLATGGKDGAIRIYDIGSGVMEFEGKGHFGPIATLVFNANGSKLISGGDDNLIRVWALDVNLWGESFSFCPDGSHYANTTVTFDAINPNHGNRSRSFVSICDSNSNAIVSEFGCANFTNSQSVIFVSDEKIALANGNAVEIWNWKNPTMLKTLNSHTSNVCGLALHSSGRTLASVSNDGCFKTWSLENYSEIGSVSVAKESGDLYDPEHENILIGNFVGSESELSFSTCEDNDIGWVINLDTGRKYAAQNVLLNGGEGQHTKARPKRSLVTRKLNSSFQHQLEIRDLERNRVVRQYNQLAGHSIQGYQLNHRRLINLSPRGDRFSIGQNPGLFNATPLEGVISIPGVSQCQFIHRDKGTSFCGLIYLDGRIEVIELETKTVVWSIQAEFHPDKIQFSTDGNSAIGWANGYPLTIWAAGSERSICELNNFDSILNLHFLRCFAHNERMTLAFFDCFFKNPAGEEQSEFVIWDISKGKRLKLSRDFEVPDPSRIKINEEGSCVFSAYEGGEPWGWDLTNDRELQKIDGSQIPPEWKRAKNTHESPRWIPIHHGETLTLVDRNAEKFGQRPPDWKDLSIVSPVWHEHMLMDAKRTENIVAIRFHLARSVDECLARAALESKYFGLNDRSHLALLKKGNELLEYEFYKDAERCFRQAILGLDEELSQEKWPEEHAFVQETLLRFGDYLIKHSRVKDAVDYLSPVAKNGNFEGARKLLGCYRDLKDHDRLIAVSSELGKAFNMKYAEKPDLLADGLTVLAYELNQSREFSSAEPLLRDGIQVLMTASIDDWRLARLQLILGITMLALERMDEASLLIETAYQKLQSESEKIPDDIRSRLLEEAQAAVGTLKTKLESPIR